jgi:hypothetical protein
MTTEVPLSTVRARLDEMVGMWFATPIRGSISRTGTPRVPVMMNALVGHVHTLARAIRVLDDAGQHIATFPLARQVLECSVTAIWLELFNDRAAQVVQRELFRNGIATMADINRAGAGIGVVETVGMEEQVAALSAVAAEQSKKFLERTKEIAGIPNAYLKYRALSSMSHADGLITFLYHDMIPPTSESGPQIRLNNEAEDWGHEMVMRDVLSYTVRAAFVFDKFDSARPNRTRIKQIAREIDVPLDWSASALGHTRQARFEKAERHAKRAGHGPGKRP